MSEASLIRLLVLKIFDIDYMVFSGMVKYHSFSVFLVYLYTKMLGASQISQRRPACWADVENRNTHGRGDSDGRKARRDSLCLPKFWDAPLRCGAY